MANPTYDGAAIFGRSVKVRHLQNPSAAQVSEFFGVNGQLSLYGGGRGRTFLVEGVLVGDGTEATLSGMIALILSYDDGIARDFTDTLGNTWSDVVFRRMDPPEILANWNATYKCQFDGLL